MEENNCSFCGSNEIRLPWIGISMGMAGNNYNFCEPCLKGMTADEFWELFFEKRCQNYPPILTAECQKVFDIGRDHGDVIYGWCDGALAFTGTNKKKLSLAEKERRKMTHSLRYKILRSDNFSCRICGATAENDRLAVDHITPIAKGGKTEPLNLRTLCYTCNSGKGTKLD